MKIKANKRPRMVRGMLSCRCCDDLYDKPYKLDKQMLKELVEEINDVVVGPCCLDTVIRL